MIARWAEGGEAVFTMMILRLACGLAVVCGSAAALAASGGDSPPANRGDLLGELPRAKAAVAAEAEDGGARLEYAGLLYEAGEFERAEDVVGPLLEVSEPDLGAVLLGARLAYLSGRYGDAETLFGRALSLDANNPRALTGLVLTFYQTDRYERCRELSEGAREATKLPHLEMMLAFEGERPYQVTWGGERPAVIPFLAADPLPIIEIEVEGTPLNALIDTGADTFVLDREIAESLGIEIVASMTGVFAGGQGAEVGFARARSLRIGNVTVGSVPIAVLPTKRLTLGDHVIGGIVGTNLLRHFLPTIDYPNARLILRDRSDGVAPSPPGGGVECEIPFYLQGTHFLLAHGSLNGRDGLLFHVDSGLAGEPAFAAPLETLEYVGIPVPEVAVHEGTVGGGGGGFAFGTFPIEALGLGPLVQRDLVGSYGALPPGSYRRLGFILDGLISHNFLKQHAWTIDFSRMRMAFTR
jgi:hypothetical protein